MKRHPAHAFTFCACVLMFQFASAPTFGAQGQTAGEQTDAAASDCAHVQVGKTFSTFFAMGLVNWEVVAVFPEDKRAKVRDLSGGQDAKKIPCDTIPKEEEKKS